MQSVRNDQIISGTYASAQTWVIDTQNPKLDILSVELHYVNATTAGKTFSYLSGNSVTMTAHGQVTGSLGQCTTTGTLPTGLSTSTNYYIIVVDANTVKFASSLANAVAGTAVALSGAGTGTDTFTPTTSASNVAKLQGSNTSTNWVDISGDTVTIATSTGTSLWDLGRIGYRYVQVVYTPSAGQITLTGTIYGQADK